MDPLDDKDEFTKGFTVQEVDALIDQVLPEAAHPHVLKLLNGLVSLRKSLVPHEEES